MNVYMNLFNPHTHCMLVSSLGCINCTRDDLVRNFPTIQFPVALILVSTSEKYYVFNCTDSINVKLPGIISPGPIY